MAKNYSKNIKLIALHNLCNNFEFSAAIALLYFAEITGSYALAMSIYSVVMISAAVFEVPTGILSDFIGRKKTLIIGSISITIGMIFSAIGINYWILFIGAVFLGLARSFFSGNNDALLHDTCKIIGKEKEFDELLGKTSSMFQIALAIGAVSGGIIGFFSFKMAMWLSVLPQAISIIIALLIMDTPKYNKKESTNIYSHFKDAIKLFIKNKKLRLLSISNIIGFGVGESAHQFKVAFINTLWPVWAIGISRFISHVLAYFSFWFSGKIIKRIGALKVQIITNIFSYPITLLAVILKNVFSPVILALPSAFFGVSLVAGQKLLHEQFTDNQRATMGSMISLFGTIMFGGFSILLGFLADKTNPSTALFIALICQIPAISIDWYLMKKFSSRK